MGGKVTDVEGMRPPEKPNERKMWRRGGTGPDTPQPRAPLSAKAVR